MLPANTTRSDPSITPLGGNNPVQASVWWNLAAEKNLQAALQALALVNQVLTREQIKLATNIGRTQRDKLRMTSSAPLIPAGKGPDQARQQVIDWSTGFFVSQDGFIITGKHLLFSGKRF